MLRELDFMNLKIFGYLVSSYQANKELVLNDFIYVILDYIMEVWIDSVGLEEWLWRIQFSPPILHYSFGISSTQLQEILSDFVTSSVVSQSLEEGRKPLENTWKVFDILDFS